MAWYERRKQIFQTKFFTLTLTHTHTSAHESNHYKVCTSPDSLWLCEWMLCASVCVHEHAVCGDYCKPVFQVNEKRKYSLKRLVLFRYNCPVDQFRITFKKLNWRIMKHTILYIASTHKAKSACRYAFILLTWKWKMYECELIHVDIVCLMYWTFKKWEKKTDTNWKWKWKWKTKKAAAAPTTTYNFSIHSHFQLATGDCPSQCTRFIAKKIMHIAHIFIDVLYQWLYFYSNQKPIWNQLFADGLTFTTNRANRKGKGIFVSFRFVFMFWCFLFVSSFKKKYLSERSIHCLRVPVLFPIIIFRCIIIEQFSF